MYTVLFSDSALADLGFLRKSEQQIVFAAIQRQVLHEPLMVTRNRKPLRRNDLASWEARSGPYRIFYDVNEEAQLVGIKAVGIKEHNRLLIRGEEYQL